MSRCNINKANLHRKIFCDLMIILYVIFVIGIYLSKGEFLRNIFFLNQADYFMDFFNSIQYGKDPYGNNVIYPPFINVLYGFLGHVIPDAIKANGTVSMRDSNIGMMVFFIYNLLQIFLFMFVSELVLNFSKSEKYKILFVILLSQPLLFCFQRGNSVFLAMTCMMFFVALYDSDKLLYRNFGYFMLGIAAGIKIYPAIFGIILIRERKWKETVVCFLYGVIIFTLPFFVLDGGLRNFPRMFENIKNCSIAFSENRLGGKHNITNFLDIVESFLNKDFAYLNVCLIAFIALASIFIVVFCRNIESWKVYALLASMMIFLPSFSYTYNLVFMVIPLMFFLKEGIHGKKDIIYSVLYVLVFAPVLQQTEDILGMDKIDDYPLTYGVLIQNIALIIMFILICLDAIYIVIKGIKNRKIVESV